MALQKTVIFRGIQVPNAYIKVMWTKVWKDSFGEMQMWFSIQKKSSVECDAFDTQDFQIPYNLNGANVLTQAYEYLKSQQEYLGSTDI